MKLKWRLAPPTRGRHEIPAGGLRQWRTHLELARRFREAEEAALTPEQLRQLRALGYIR